MIEVYRHKVVTYSTEKFGERKSIISSERPNLAGRCSNFTDDSHNEGDDDDSGHDSRSSIAPCGIVEQLEEGKARGTVEKPRDVSHGKA